MKTQSIKIVALALLLAGTAVACGEKVENKPQGNVPYKSCDCRKEKTGYIKTDAVLFKNLTEEQVNEKIYQSGFSGVMMVYNSIADSISLYSVQTPMLDIGNICNFPDFAMKWNIPEQGLDIYLEYERYNACNPYGSIATVTYSSIILTTLNLK